MTRKKVTCGTIPDWPYVYDTYAKLGYRVIPVDYEDMEYEGPYEYVPMLSKDLATTDRLQIQNFPPFCYWAIQIGTYCGVLVIRFTDMDKHEAFIKQHGRFPKTAIIESPVHRDYLYKFTPIVDKPFFDELEPKNFDLLYNDEFIIVPPSQNYKWSKDGNNNLKRIAPHPGGIYRYE